MKRARGREPEWSIRIATEVFPIKITGERTSVWSWHGGNLWFLLFGVAALIGALNFTGQASPWWQRCIAGVIGTGLTALLVLAVIGYRKLRKPAAASKPAGSAPGPSENDQYPCPCCFYRTLTRRGEFEMCEVCSWEDDGQDDHDADVVRGGPNGSLSLTEARIRFQEGENAVPPQAGGGPGQRPVDLTRHYTD